MPSILIRFIKREILQKRNAWVLACGALAGLGASALLPSGIGLIILWGAMGVWLYYWRQLVSPVTSAIAAFTWGVGYYGVLLLWMWAIHPLAWMGFPDPLSILIAGAGWVLAVGCQALIVSMVFAATSALAKVLRHRYLAQHPVWLWVSTSLVLSLLWSYGVWWLNEQPLRMPWGFFSYAHADVMLIRLASAPLTFWGLEAVLMLMMLTVSYLAESLINNHRLSRPGLAVLVTLLMTVTSAARLHPAVVAEMRPLDEAPTRSVIPVLVQSNVTIETEHQPDFKSKHVYPPLLTQAMATLKPVDLPQALVIFPEGIETYSPQGNLTICGGSACPAALVTGGVIWRPEPVTGKLVVYNAILGYAAGQPKAVGAIDKRPLVAFGEKIPFVRRGWLTSVMKQFGIDYGESFTEGVSGQAPLSITVSPKHALRVGGLICFEALYPTIVRQYQQHGMDVLVTVGNLGWFHHHPMIEPQFIRFNQFRAAESARPLILLTNTGTSAVIDNKGAIRMQLPSGKRRVVRGPRLELLP